MSRTPNTPDNPVAGGSGYKPVTPWKHAPGEGWQHGRLPAPPKEVIPGWPLSEEGKATWKEWLGSWWASFYTPEDLPALRLALRVYDMALQGWPAKDMPTPLAPLLKELGLTPKGRHDLRWLPKLDKQPADLSPTSPKVAQIAERREARKKKLA